MKNHKVSSSLIIFILLSSIFSGTILSLAIPVLAQTSPQDGLVAHWAFDEGSGNTVADSSGNGNTGTLINGPVWIDGKIGKALSFDGVDDYVQVPQSSSLDVTTQVTVEAWVYPRAYISSDGGDTHIVSRCNIMGGAIYVLGTFSDGKVQYAVNPYPNASPSQATLPLITWTHLAMTYDGSEVVLYINGVFNSSYTLSGPIDTTSNWLAIGCKPTAPQGGAGTYAYFNGIIDDVRIYNTALSQQEIQNDMTGASTGISVTCSPNPAYAGSPVTCTATVYGSNPTGTVKWSTTSITGGSFSPSSASTLSSGSCSATYTDTSTGPVTITANYSGDANNAPSSGNITLTLTPSQTYPVTFIEDGLAQGTQWSVTFNGQTQSSTSDSIRFYVPNGVYAFSITRPSGYAAATSEMSGSINMTGANVGWPIAFIPITVTFTESGLPSGIEWSVTLERNGNFETQSSTSDSVIFDGMADGSYFFSVNLPLYYTAPTFEIAGTLTVNGKDVTAYPITVSPNPPPKIQILQWNVAKDSYNIPNPGSDWSTGGQCYGFASTALMYFMHYTLGMTALPYFPSQNPAATSTSDLALSAFQLIPIIGTDWWFNTLNNVTLAVTFQQVLGQIQRKIVNPSPYDNFVYLVENLSMGQPVVLTLHLIGGSDHAVVAWGVEPEMRNGNPTSIVDIDLYDPIHPQEKRVATYDLSTDSFYYASDGHAFNIFYVVNPTKMIADSVENLDYETIDKSLQMCLTPINHMVQFPFPPGYTIVMAGPTIATISTSNGLKDFFTTPGNSQTFVCGIPGSSGIEEGKIQVYAIPSDITFSIQDPSLYQSTILIIRVDNESGQIMDYGCLLKTITTPGPLNCIVIPSSAGLSIISESEVFNANAIFFSANQQGYSIFHFQNISVSPMQKLNFTVTDWQMLNSTSPSPVTLTSSRADIPPTTVLAIGTPKYVSSGNIYVSAATPFVLSTEDNLGGIGVASTSYRIYNNTYSTGWLAYSSGFQLVGLQDGKYSVDYNSTDNVGNFETTNSITIILDNMPPTTTLTIGSPEYVSGTAYVTSQTPFTLAATDSISGVSSTAYRIRNSTYSSGWLTYSPPFNLTGLVYGSYNVSYYSTDNAGNTEQINTVNVTVSPAQATAPDYIWYIVGAVIILIMIILTAYYVMVMRPKTKPAK